MKRKWLYVLLVLSLAVNTGVLGVFAVNKYRDWRWQENYWRNWLKSKAALGTIDSLFAAHHVHRESLGRPYWQARQALGRLALEPSPDSARAESLLSVMAAVDRDVNWLWQDLVFGMRAVQRPERVAQWKKRTVVEAESARRADSLWDVWWAEKRRGTEGER